MAATNKNKAAAAAKEERKRWDKAAKDAKGKAANGTTKIKNVRKPRPIPMDQNGLAGAMKRQGAAHARKVEKNQAAPAEQQLGAGQCPQRKPKDISASKIIGELRQLSNDDQNEVLQMAIQEIGQDRRRLIESFYFAAEEAKKSLSKLEFAISQA